MGFVQNRRFSIFSHWHMERSQNWPDLRSLISTFWDMHFIDTVTCVNRWKFQDNRSVSVALTSIQTFFMRWDHLTWPGDLTLRDLSLKFAQHMRKRCTIGLPKRRRCAPPSSGNLEKTGGGLSRAPTPIRARIILALGFWALDVCSAYSVLSADCYAVNGLTVVKLNIRSVS